MTKTLTLDLAPHAGLNCGSLTVLYTDVECVNTPTSTRFTIPVKNYYIDDTDYIKTLNETNQFISAFGDPAAISWFLNIYTKTHEYVRNGIADGWNPSNIHLELVEMIINLTRKDVFIRKLFSYNERWRNPDDKNTYCLGSDLVALSLYTKLLVPITGAIAYLNFSNNKNEKGFSSSYEITSLFDTVIKCSPFDRALEFLRIRVQNIVDDYSPGNGYMFWQVVHPTLLSVYLPQFNAEEVKRSGKNPDKEILSYLYQSAEKEAQKIQRHRQESNQAQS